MKNRMKFWRHRNGEMNTKEKDQMKIGKKNEEKWEKDEI